MKHSAKLLRRSGILALAWLAGASAPAAADALAFVANRADDSLSVIDTASDTVIATVPVAFFGIGEAPVAVHPDGSRVYVAGELAISVVATDTFTVVDSIPKDGFTPSLAISPDGSRLYVLQVGAVEELIAIDTVSLEVAASYDQGIDILSTSMAISPDGSQLYVGALELWEFDAATLDLVETVPLGNWVDDELAFSPDGSLLYVFEDSTPQAQVFVVDPATNGVLDTIPTNGDDPTGIAVDPNRPRLYFVDASTDTFTTVRTQDNQVIGVRPVGADPQSVAVHPDGSRLYVVNSGDGTTWSIDLRDLATEIVTVGADPHSSGGLFIGPGSIGGSVRGIDLTTVTCLNSTTGQSIVVTPPPGVKGWDCTSAGLDSSPGDIIRMLVQGVEP